MKQFLTIIFFFSSFISHANMASPYIPGTSSSTVYSSKDVDILKEKILIKLNKNFESADYVIEYYINAETAGNQIPLLFHAIDYSKNFKVFVDGKEIKIYAKANAAELPWGEIGVDVENGFKPLPTWQDALSRYLKEIEY